MAGLGPKRLALAGELPCQQSESDDILKEWRSVVRGCQ